MIAGCGNQAHPASTRCRAEPPAGRRRPRLVAGPAKCLRPAVFLDPAAVAWESGSTSTSAPPSAKDGTARSGRWSATSCRGGDTVRVAEPSVAPAEPAARDAPCVGPENGNISTSVPDAAAERLHALYIEELERVLAPPVHPMVDERQTRALIRTAHAAGPGVREAPDETTWIWSDLHLGHKLSLGVFFRSFATVRGADRAMMDARYDLGGADHTIICVGDVGVDHSVQAHHPRWCGRRPERSGACSAATTSIRGTTCARSRWTGPWPRCPHPASRRCC